jgi:hypothetical protein
METETPFQQFYTPYEQKYDFNFSTMDYSSTDNELDTTNDTRRPSEASTYLPVPSIQGSESRLSEFYDAYYRDSTIAPESSITIDVDAKRGVSTIAEVDTPLPSPGFRFDAPMKEKADSLFSVKSKVEMSISSPMFLKERPVEREEPVEIKKTWCRARAYGMIAR